MPKVAKKSPNRQKNRPNRQKNRPNRQKNRPKGEKSPNPVTLILSQHVATKFLKCFMLNLIALARLPKLSQ
jgi:hypothetical protein